MPLRDFDLRAAIWEEAAKIERKARRGPKLYPELTRSECRERVRSRLQLLVERGSTAGLPTEYAWLRGWCSRCRRCDVPPA